MQLALVERANSAWVVGPRLGRDDRGDAAVLVAAVAGREGGDDLVGAGDRLGVDHDDARVHVAVVDGLGRAVGVHGPQVVELDLAAVDVFPAGVEDAAVGQHPGRVVVLGVGRDALDVRAVGVAAVEDADLGHPAVDPAVAAGGDEDDVAVGQVGGLEVVVRAVGELAQARAVDVDLVEVVVAGACLAVGEEDPLAVVVDLRVADGAARVVDDRGDFAGSRVPPGEPAGVGDRAVAGEGHLVFIVAVVADVGVPVRVVVLHAGAEDDFLDVGQRAFEGIFEEWAWLFAVWLLSLCGAGRGKGQKSEEEGGLSERKGEKHCLAPGATRHAIACATSKV